MAEVTVTPEQNGRVVVVKVGDSIAVQLPENPTTGYSWAIDSLDAGLLEAGGTSHHGAGAGLGTGGVRTWALRARTPGTTRSRPPRHLR